MSVRVSLGIDIGGTFTDLVLLDHVRGTAAIWKESTTPDDPSRGALAGVRHLIDRHGADPARIDRVVHATTLFTNALIERKGARTGLLTTAGFADILEIGSERKYELYDLAIDPPVPLVPRAWRRDVVERLGPDGSVVTPIDLESVLQETETLVREGVESLAVVFLHAYANARHEQAAARAIAERFPNLPVSVSSAIAPEIREYARASTTVANAYIRPIAEKYVGNLSRSLKEIGIAGALLLMLSSGGLADIEEAMRAPVRLLESGPAAGALAGAHFGRAAGLERVLAFDMGGTTAKMAIIDDFEPTLAWGFEAAREKRFLRGSGLPIQIAAVDLVEIGAGGGSIARRGELGTLQVGPESAGAVPGPACYGRGNPEPTVTDADLALGLIDAAAFLGGAMRIDRPAALRTLGVLGQALGLEGDRVAEGVHAVVAETMAGAARVALAEHGASPQHYVLLATGGAGPVHAWDIARRLGIRRILCPAGAGAGSALGMLLAPARVDRVSSVMRRMDVVQWAEIDERFRRMERSAEEIAGAAGADIARARVRFMADMRYSGQGFEITIPVPTDLSMHTVQDAFESRYRALFSRTVPGASIELVSLRLALTAEMPGAVGQVSIQRREMAQESGERTVWFDGAEVPAAVHRRSSLRVGARFSGPAVLEEDESTLVIGPQGEAEVLMDGSVLVTVPA